MLSWNCWAFVTRPSMTSKQAMSRLVSMPGPPASQIAGAKLGERDSSESPSGPLFSAWNWVAMTLPRATTEQNSAPYSVTPSDVGRVGRQRVVASSRSRSAPSRAAPAANGWDDVRRTAFQPIWGTRARSRGTRTTSPGTQPRQSASPSSLCSKSTCRPMQMPRNGTPSPRTRSWRYPVQPRSRSDAMVTSAAPTPGRMKRSTPWASSGAATRRASRPRWCSA